jgi:hypothetical protein
MSLKLRQETAMTIQLSAILSAYFARLSLSIRRRSQLSTKTTTCWFLGPSQLLMGLQSLDTNFRTASPTELLTLLKQSQLIVTETTQM